MSKVIELRLRDKKKESQLVKSIYVKPLNSIENSNNKKNYREISILVKNEDNKENQGICYYKFKPDILLDDLDFKLLKLKSLIKINDVVLEVIEIGKECHKECSTFFDKEYCQLRNYVIFAKVINCGTIFLDDKIEITYKE